MIENIRSRRPVNPSIRKKEIIDKEQQTQYPAHTLIENFCWLTASVISIYYSDIVNVILNEKTIYR